MALGKFQDIEPNLDRTPHGGGIGAKRFSELLERRCKCKLAWQKHRRTYIVYRMENRKVISYMDLSPDKHFPLVPALIPLIFSTVNTINAAKGDDPERSLREYMARNKRKQDEGIKKYVDDRFPDFRAYAEYSWRKLNDRTSRPVVV
jgi:hypothetical protein